MGLFKAGKEHKKRTIKAYELWDKIIATALKKNDSLRGVRKSDNFYMDLKGIYSGQDNVTYLYTLDKYPSELELLYRTTIRKECKNGVRISFISLYEKHKIAWNSAQIKSRLRTWERTDEANEQKGITEYNLYDNLMSMDSVAWRKASLSYLSKAELRRKRKTFMVRTMMLISGKRGTDFNETVDAVTTLCDVMNIKCSRVLLNIQDYLQVFSPFSLTYNDKIWKMVGRSIYTDELIARFSTYTQGTVGINGIEWGVDIFSGFPCLKPVKKTTESAENWLITAETGGGKSLFVKVLLLQLLGFPWYNATIMDIEGFEYVYIAYFLAKEDSVKIINMAEGQGAYFDPVEIILTGDEQLDADMKGISFSFTVAMIKTLLGDSVTKEWVDVIVNDAVTLTYQDVGVTSNPKTWYKAKGLTLFKVYDKLVSFQYDEERMKNEDYAKAIDICIGKLKRYFEKDGSRADMFKNRVTLDEIKSAKLVLCSFGMAGKSPQTVDPVQMGLMQLCAANISHLRSIFSKNEGKYNIKVWEEFQRWGHFPDSEKTITTALTGGRKLGDINIILTNIVSELLTTDKFKVFENTTTVAIGCIRDADVRRNLCNRLSIPEMLPELDALEQGNQDTASFTDGDSEKASMIDELTGEFVEVGEGEDAMDSMLLNPYCKAFLIGLDRTAYTLARMYVPRDLRRSPILKTGVSLTK